MGQNSKAKRDAKSKAKVKAQRAAIGGTLPKDPHAGHDHSDGGHDQAAHDRGEHNHGAHDQAAHDRGEHDHSSDDDK